MTTLSHADQIDELIKELILARYDLSTGKHRYADERLTVIGRMLQSLHAEVLLSFHRSGEGPRA